MNIWYMINSNNKNITRYSSNKNVTYSLLYNCTLSAFPVIPYFCSIFSIFIFLHSYTTLPQLYILYSDLGIGQFQAVKMDNVFTGKIVGKYKRPLIIKEFISKRKFFLQISFLEIS